MKVILAESAGFCYGVKRAVELALETAQNSENVFMLGSIIHNTHVVEELRAKGAVEVKDISSLKAGDTVIIRSHGEKKEILDELERRGVTCVNATCP